MHSSSSFYSVYVRRAVENCDERVSPRTYRPNDSPELHQFLCNYLWRWLGSPLAALRYVMCFRFQGRHHICTQWVICRHVDTVAGSDVMGRHAKVNALAVSYWLRHVLVDSD